MEKIKTILGLLLILSCLILSSNSQSGNSSTDEDTPICGGFLEIDPSMGAEKRKEIDYSNIIVQSFTTDMILKEQTNLAASGYYFLPVYENESFVLKISGPYGMSFEPEQYVLTVDENHSVQSLCQNDINFKFRGFLVEGQVSTFGSNDGPEGINLVLFDEKEQKIQTSKTGERGLFKFEPVNPGNYILRPHDNIQMFDENHKEIRFLVNVNSNNFLERALVIRGYHVSGRIEADNKPLSNVMVFIYSFNSTLVNNYNCDYTPVKNLNDFKFEETFPFCGTLSDSEGNFSFKNIPYGKFMVKSIYKNQYVSYNLDPEFLTIDVQHKDYVISNPLQVTYFSIYGRVINSKGKGIPNVTIKIDGQVRAITDVHGIYKLEKLTPGNYDLEAQADDMFFEPLTNIRITAHLNNLPDMVVTDYKLCGKILIEATEYYSTSKRTVVLQNASDKSSKKERRTITDQKGRYCFEVKPGLYHIFPVLTLEEKESDLHLQPEFYDLEVVDTPLLDVNFYQSKVTVSGKISCLDNCDPNMKIRLISTKTDRMLSTQINEKQEFQFKDILSGQYKLAIIKPEWCWAEEDIIIKVQNSDIRNVNFVQSGYSMFYSSNNDINIEWENFKTHTKMQTVLEKKKSKICLPAQGKYKVTPKSCYIFKESFFVYETDKSSRLDLIPIEYNVKGLVQIEDGFYENFSKLNLSHFTINISIDENVNNKNLKYKKLDLSLSGKESVIDFYTKPKTQLTITPEIPKDLVGQENFKNLIFFPKFKNIDINHSCLEDPNLLKFEMKTGLIIEGKVSPGMDGVLISSYNKKNNELVSTTMTDSDGRYTIGPLYKEFDYEIKASKDGYKIVPEPKNQFDFIAEKLSFLRVKIVDTNKKPLSSVFLSLSSADRGFKINNNTNSEGYFDFVELYSGEYYIKPLFKEYKFEPSQKLVKILGGQHYEETLVAHRIAFSIYGKINNLNREKVEGLYIQALDEKTRQLQETSIDKNGEYRLRGLIPGRKYIIKVKIPANSSIEKALPSSIPITLGNDDVTGVDFVVLQRPKKIDVRGYLNYMHEKEDKCPFNKVQNTYVELTKLDDEEDNSPVIKQVSNACQFVYRNLDKKRYQIKVYERQVKISTNPKLLYEKTIDLSDEREISGGVKILKIDIESFKKSVSDNLNYTIYSPIMLFVFIFSILKYDYTVWLFTNFISKPYRKIRNIYDRIKNINK